ncbi:MAG: ribonuclease P protein component, partial [Octadecabacter sp.]|nr:ribonuclease P protein component [Octadecabacter sp.]
MAQDEPPPTAASPGVFSVAVLGKRADFLRAARAKRAPSPGFMLQARKRAPDEAAETPIRVGYT